MRHLNAQDAMFVYMERTGTPMHLTSLFLYDQSTVPTGHVRHTGLLEYLSGRLDASPIFRQELLQVPLQLDRPYWVDDDRFDLEYHVRHVALPKPRDWRQLAIMFSRIHARPLDLTRPPWEMHIIEGLDHVAGTPAGSFALVVKYHHSAIDGVSGTEMLDGLNDRTSTPPARSDPRPWQAKPAPSEVELVGRAALSNALLLVHAVLQSKSLLASTLGFARHAIDSGSVDLSMAKPAPRTRFNGRIGPHRVFDGASFPLSDFREIKAQAACTINDVLIAVTAGMLRRYLLDKGELPGDPLVAAVPVSIRTPGEKVTPGNAITAMLASLCTNVADPLDRLAAIAEATRASKELVHAVGARDLVTMADNIPATALALAGRLMTSLGLGQRLSLPFNCVITNMPGPQVPLYMDGAQMTGMFGSGPVVDGLGLLVSANSYNGRIFVSLGADRDMLPDPGFMHECLETSTAELLAAARARAGQRESRGADKAQDGGARGARATRPAKRTSRSGRAASPSGD